MQVTDDLKHHIKLGRKLGIHVSPAVVVDGVVEESIESRYTLLIYWAQALLESDFMQGFLMQP